MRFWMALVAVLAALFAGVGAFGDDTKGAAKSGCQASAQAQTVDTGKCSVAKQTCKVGDKSVAYEMPAMMYKVGDKQTCCEKTALEMAKGDAKNVRFVVGDKEFTDKTEAMAAYATVLDSFFNEKMFAVKYAVGDESLSCPMSAQELATKKHLKMRYRVASFTFDDMNAVDKAVASAKQAAGSVGNAKGASCCAKAGSKAAALTSDSKSCAGAAETKTVAASEAKSCAHDGAAKTVASAAGETKTVASDAPAIGCCQETAAKVELAKAKIDAAVKALAEAAGA